MILRFAAVIVSALLLSAGWLGMTGLTLFAAFIPLLWISSSYDASRRSWWCVFGWAALTFALWNALTIWWIWFATPVGPFAATLASTFLNMIAFMLFHTVSKKAPKALAYTLLVAAWIATEYWYTVGEFSWPWLILGNGFSHDVRLVQWYEYTGVFGGSLWVLVVNILLFEAWRAPRRIARWVVALSVLFLPMVVSGILYFNYKAPNQGSIRVSVIQPNVDCYDKFHGGTEWQERNIIALLGEVPSDAQFIALPETAVPNYYWEPQLSETPYFNITAPMWVEITDSMRSQHPNALLVTGANTKRAYAAGMQTSTARSDQSGGWYDHFNTAVGLDTTARLQLHHKGRLVIGAEKTPLPWLFKWLDFLVIDLGGTLGQLGVGQTGTVFEHEGAQIGPAICYEGLYGDFYGDFVRRGAQAMFIISNDGWWGNTLGYKHLFSISRLRAVEHRRAIARSANTGISGFIDARGDVRETLGWEQRGVLTDTVALNMEQTLYTRCGDYIGRLAQYLMLLCVLYYIAYRAKKKNHLV
ncbi:MAG: apolipoprotein N-acyltransferase [Alistipes sp.]